MGRTLRRPGQWSQRQRSNHRLERLDGLHGKVVRIPRLHADAHGRCTIAAARHPAFQRGQAAPVHSQGQQHYARWGVLVG